MKKYTTPEIELLALAANDVILTSQLDEDPDVLSLEETAQQHGFTAIDGFGKNQGFSWQSNWGNW